MSELAVRAIENARKERRRIAASTALPADEWGRVSARFAALERAERPEQSSQKDESDPKAPAPELDDDTKDLLPLPSSASS